MAQEGAQIESPPFSLFCALVNELSNIEPRKIGQPKPAEPRSHSIFIAWVKYVKENNKHPDAIKHFFRMFFPEEGVRRRYMLQETKLIEFLAEYLNLSKQQLHEYSKTTLYGRGGGSGALGIHCREILKDKAPKYEPRRSGGMSWEEVDELLDELASHCQFSASEVREAAANRPKRSRKEILRSLLNPLTPDEIAVMVHIILRDLQPVLYPTWKYSAGEALTKYNLKQHDRIELPLAMDIWAGGTYMFDMYRIRKDVDHVCDFLSTNPSFDRSSVRTSWAPRVGVPVDIPRSARPEKCGIIAERLKQRGKAAVETKYDGERLQIHVDLTKPHSAQIQIFSKSGRDSTQDRKVLLPYIRAALGMSFDPFIISSRDTGCTFSRNAILEGEMVPFNEDERRIDEYWKLASVKKGVDPSALAGEDAAESYETGASQEERERRAAQVEQQPKLHLAIVWFDVLMVDDTSYLRHYYSQRRETLVKTVKKLDGFSFLAQRRIIDFEREDAAQLLRQSFARLITERGEGVMIKVCHSTYHEPDAWHKLKKDFIPGLGDTKDFIIIGASWQKARGTKFAVPPEVFTTFFVGFEAPEFAPSSHRSSKKHYHCHFATSYGLSREELNEFGCTIRESDPVEFSPEAQGTAFVKTEGEGLNVYESDAVEFTFSLASYLTKHDTAPTFIFKKPRVFELTGAGFQKPHGSPFYELRWPRITKFDRVDGEPLTLVELQKVALHAMRAGQQDPSSLAPAKNMWADVEEEGESEESPRARYNREYRQWLRRLEEADEIEPSEEDEEEEDTGRLELPTSESEHSAWNPFLPPPADLDEDTTIVELDSRVPAPGRRLGLASRHASIILEQAGIASTIKVSSASASKGNRHVTQAVVQSSVVPSADENVAPAAAVYPATPQQGRLSADALRSYLLEVLARSGAPSPSTGLRAGASQSHSGSQTAQGKGKKRARPDDGWSTADEEEEEKTPRPAARAGPSTPSRRSIPPQARAQTLLDQEMSSMTDADRALVQARLDRFRDGSEEPFCRYAWTTVPPLSSDELSRRAFTAGIYALTPRNYCDSLEQVLTVAGHAAFPSPFYDTDRLRTGYVFVERRYQAFVKAWLDEVSARAAATMAAVGERGQDESATVFFVDKEGVEEKGGGQRAIDENVIWLC